MAVYSFYSQIFKMPGPRDNEKDSIPNLQWARQANSGLLTRTKENRQEQLKLDGVGEAGTLQGTPGILETDTVKRETSLFTGCTAFSE